MGGRLSLLAVVLLVAAGLSCSGGSCAPPPAQPSFVWITIDTLRADHLGCYGYPRPTSPRIDDLAGRGILYENAISQAPWTLPSVASMLLGRYPRQISESLAWSFSIETDAEPVAEVMRRGGYATAAFVHQPMVETASRLRRGFADACEFEEDDRAAVDGALAWLAGAGERPFFLYVYLLAPHEPYDFHDGTTSEFADPERARAVRERTWTGSWWTGETKVVHPTTPEDIETVIGLYDGEVRYADALVGELVDALARSGLDRRTAVIVTADHGEELNDHGGWEHGHSLFDELIRVPLVYVPPGGPAAGRWVAGPVELVDLAPTVVSAAGIEPPDSFAGSALPEQDDPADAKVAQSGYVVKNPGLRAVRTADLKYIDDPRRGTEQVYDLNRDPGERTPVSADSPRIAEGRALAARIDGAIAPLRTPKVVHIRLTSKVPRRWTLDLAADAPIRPAFVEGSGTVELAAEGRGAVVVIETTDGEPVHLQFAAPLSAQVLRLDLAADGQPVDPKAIFTPTGTADRHGELLSNLVAGPNRPFLTGTHVEASTTDREQTASVWLAPVLPDGEAPDPERLRERLRKLGYIADDAVR